MTYDEAIEWLLSFADFERSGRFQDRPDVEPMLALLERLGNPHLGRATVHIAGSKGKGSVAAMLESILRAARLHTGLFTSPHLHSYCERIRDSRDQISEEEFAELVENQLRPAVLAELGSLGDRCFVTFDLLTALAFLAFRAWRVETQIIEVGLGGRVDSTNVFEIKNAAIITPISFEHTSILGDTIEKIAREKAAITTPGCIVVMAAQSYNTAEAVVRDFADAVDAPVIDVALDYRWQKLSHDTHRQDIRIEGPHSAIEARLALLGAHQIENASTAVAAAEVLASSSGFELGGDAINEGLAMLDWPCRIEVLRERPLLIADGAHNRDSARRLRETLADYFACDRAFFIIGCGSDKDIDGLADELAPLASRVIAVRADHPRAMAPQRIAEAFGKRNIDTEIADDVAGALERAMAATGESGLICVSGSLFVAAEARAHVLGLPAGRQVRTRSRD